MAGDMYLGMDFGGTKLLIGEADSAGLVLREKKYESGYMDQKEALDFIIRSLDDYFVEKSPKPKAMGLGMVGRVNNRQGIWHEIDSRRKSETPIAEILSQRYGIPCYIENDVRSAAKAEQRFGCGRNSENFIYINVGTGIAAGVVSEGRVLPGSHCNAGEVGHTHSGINLGLECVCGRKDCVESLASGGGLDSQARRLAADYPGTALVIPREGRVGAREIFALSGTDELCARLVKQAAEALANLIMNLVRVSDPDTVVLGGGLVSDGFLLPLIKNNLSGHTMRYVTNGVTLTALDPKHIGLIGACAVAMNL